MCFGVWFRSLILTRLGVSRGSNLGPFWHASSGTRPTKFGFFWCPAVFGDFSYMGWSPNPLWHGLWDVFLGFSNRFYSVFLVSLVDHVPSRTFLLVVDPRYICIAFICYSYCSLLTSSWLLSTGSPSHEIKGGVRHDIQLMQQFIGLSACKASCTDHKQLEPTLWIVPFIWMGTRLQGHTCISQPMTTLVTNVKAWWKLSSMVRGVRAHFSCRLWYGTCAVCWTLYKIYACVSSIILLKSSEGEYSRVGSKVMSKRLYPKSSAIRESSARGARAKILVYIYIQIMFWWGLVTL